MNNKGNIIDLLFIMIVVFVAVFGMVVSALFANIVNTSVSSMGPTINTTHMERSATTVFNMDIAVIALFFGMVLASVVSAYYVGSHPFFFIFSVVFLLILMVIAGVLSNTVDDVMDSSSVLSGIADRMPYTMYVGRNLPYLMLFSFVLIGLALYAGKGSSEGGGEF